MAKALVNRETVHVATEKNFSSAIGVSFLKESKPVREVVRAYVS